MLNKLFGGIAKRLGFKLLTGLIDDIANGKKGPKAQAIYWKLAGLKTYTGVILGSALVVFGVVGKEEWSTVLGSVVALVLIPGGLIDRGYRNTIPGWLLDHPLYKLLKSYGTDIAAGLSGLILYFQSGNCPSWFGWQCSTWVSIVVCVGAVLVHLGLIAWEAPAPLKPLSKE